MAERSLVLVVDPALTFLLAIVPASCDCSDAEGLFYMHCSSLKATVVQCLDQARCI